MNRAGRAPLSVIARRVGPAALSAATLLAVGCETRQLIGIQRAAEDASVDAASDAADDPIAERDGALESPARDGGSELVDGTAGSADARVDGSASRHPGELVLVILRGNVPASGMRVLFHDESGRVLADRQTGAEGTVSYAGARGLTVIAPVVFEDAGALGVLSYVGLDPSAELVLQLPAMRSGAIRGMYEVHWQGASPYLTLDIGGCPGKQWFVGKPTQVEEVSIWDWCGGQARSALAISELSDEIGRHVLEFRSASPLPPLADVTPLQLTAAHEAQRVEVSAVPVGAYLVSATGHRGDEMFDLPLETKTSGRANVPAAFPAGLLDTLLIVARSASDPRDGQAYAYQEVARRFAPQPGVRDVGLDKALPLLSAVTLETDPSGRHTISWQTPGNLGRADHGVARLRLPGQDAAHWTVVFASAGSSLTLPVLPADAARATPPVLKDLRFGDFASVTDFDAFVSKRQLMTREIWDEEVPQPELAGVQEWERTLWQAPYRFTPEAPCNTLPIPTGGDVRLKYGTGLVPGGSGGTIADGLYRLEQMLLYGADAQPPLIQGRMDTLEIKGSTWQRVAYYENTPFTRYTQKVMLEGNSFKPEFTCAEGQGVNLLGLVSSDAGEYSVVGDTLTLIVPTWTPRDGRVAFTYRRVGP